MGLTKRSQTRNIYLAVKYYCLWRGVDKPIDGCDVIDAANPSTGGTVKKYGYVYDNVVGRVTKLEKYDTGKKYSQRYFGFKMHIVDGADTFVLDMPYQSQVLRRFLRLAPNVNWDLPLSLSVFKGKKNKGEMEDTGIWFQQNGATIKPYFTREQPNGMPDATHDSFSDQWDFRAQHQWLVARLQTDTIPAIEAAAAKAAPPVPDEPHHEKVDDHEAGPPNDFGAEGITDDDIPF